MSDSVSALLSEKYGIEIRSGSKGKCPFCEHATFSIKRDDSIGKCFHPSCGRFIAPGLQEARHENYLHRVMENIFQKFHAHLLAPGTTIDQNHAYTYLVCERKVYPEVVGFSMLGSVPRGYDCRTEFDLVIATLGAAKVERSKRVPGNKSTADDADHEIEFLIEARGKFRDCARHLSGWIAFFYTNELHKIVGIRFREPYSKNIFYFKPYENLAGLFGHGFFSPHLSKGGNSFDDSLLITEGEFNQLQMQSLALRYHDSTGQDVGHVSVCSVGGVNNADYEVIRKTSRRPLICYDNDSDGAGFALVTNARKTMSVCAFTTPNPDSDLDEFIRSFGDNPNAAWQSIQSLITGSKSFSRTYSGNGREFLRDKKFIPKRLGDAIMAQQELRYSASALWVYTGGVYRPDGELLVRNEAQTLLGEERTEYRVIETLRYIETATTFSPADPNLLYINLSNGRLDWKTGNLERHSPDSFEIVQLPVSYDPGADCPFFDRYLQTALEPETIPLVEEIIGYCLIPDTRFEKAVTCLGGGGNGKGTLLDTIIALLGKENVSAVSLQDLAENRFRVAELHGKLANIFADLDNRALNSSSTFKTLVTGDLITAERKFGQPFSFRSHARLIFSTNNLPQNTDRTHAFYRRQLVIPFKRTFTEIDADLELRVRLRTELPGILNVALRGLRRLFSQGHFSESRAVKAAVEEYRRQNDSVAAFCAEHVVNDPNGTIEKAKFYSKYKLWCESEELRPDSQTRLKSSMKRIFPKLDEIRSSRGRCSWHWKGISLKAGT